MSLKVRRRARRLARVKRWVATLGVGHQVDATELVARVGGCDQLDLAALLRARGLALLPDPVRATYRVVGA